MTEPNRQLHFTPIELTRIRECARALNTSYADFIHHATMQAVDECEGIGQQVRQRWTQSSA
jgi:hypothetical protein